ncbi:uncharacterized protein [Diadema setosum]|uniref:uncharacterized protein n=1 Tax=Diadema antillarum TaxID=105358 RepID=UPI003A8A30BD
MRRVSTLDEYINAFRINDTTRSVNSRYSIYRNPSSVSKRSFRRLGRAGKDSSRDNEFMDRVKEEQQRARCQPRDQVVDAYEELGIPRGYNQFIYPECIVVRRCKQGGCCRDDQECESSRRTNITMNFFINAVEITRDIEHDTECECQDKPSFCPPPVMDCPDTKVWSYSECTCKCRNPCPKPFLQDEDSCACDCLTKDRNCKNIYRGRRGQKLSREQCDCVKKGLCAVPPCSHSTFSIQHCRCSNSSS